VWRTATEITEVRLAASSHSFEVILERSPLRATRSYSWSTPRHRHPRLDLIHRPLSDLFIVYNPRRLTDQPVRANDGRALILKYTHLLAFWGRGQRKEPDPRPPSRTAGPDQVAIAPLFGANTRNARWHAR